MLLNQLAEGRFSAIAASFNNLINSASLKLGTETGEQVNRSMMRVKN